MADYIYLLQTRLTPAQQTALAHVRDAARARNLTVFLVGGAVRDLTSGSPIRDLDVVVQGVASKLTKDLEKLGGLVVGESVASQSLHLHFPGGVRMEVGSTLAISFPKPGKPVAKPANILDDLRRRDFTANAMAISLNEGSYGLLMDPLNGVADIENRELRLISNYGFIEDPSRMVRAIRFSARLGWSMEEKTQARYDTGKKENYIAALNSAQRGYETEEILREEDPLRVLRKLESEGWMKHLFPAWSASKANEAELNRLRDTIGQLGARGIFPDPSAAYFPLLTAKLAPKDVAALKRSFARPGFAKQIERLEADSKAFGLQFMAKEAAAPSVAWKMLSAAVPETVLWLAHTSKSVPVQARFKAFFNDWPQARQRIPYTLMQEMRITPDLPGYDALVEQIFFAIMDGKLDTPEAARAYLEPHSPPAPPPPVNMRRRAVKRDVKPVKPRAKKGVAAPVDAPADAADSLAPVPVSTTRPVAAKAAASKASAPVPVAVKGTPAKAAPAAKPAKEVSVSAAKEKPAQVPLKVAKDLPKPVAKALAKPGVKTAASKKAGKPAPSKAAKQSAATAKTAKPKVVASARTAPRNGGAKAGAKAASKAAHKTGKSAGSVKPAGKAGSAAQAIKPAKKPVLAKKSAKPVARKAAPKPKPKSVPKKAASRLVKKSKGRR